MYAIYILLAVTYFNNVCCKRISLSPITTKNYLHYVKIHVTQFNGTNITSNDFNTPLTTASMESGINNSFIISIEQEEPDKSWESYADFLITISMNELNKIVRNICNNYNLEAAEINTVKKHFNNSILEYEYLFKYKLKNIVGDNQFNVSWEFRLELMYISNDIVEKIVEFNLDKARSVLSAPTFWYKQTLKDKILRQQLKASFASIETQICSMASVCTKKKTYSDFIIEWLRFLLNERDSVLKEFFESLNVMLEKHKEFVKTSNQFTKNIKYASRIDGMGKRDIIDFIDETITNPNIFQLIPDPLIKCTLLLNYISKALDDIYTLNVKNSKELESITQMFNAWNGSVDGIKEIWDAILKNMQLNFKTWPKKTQEDIKRIWSEIIFM